MKSTVRVASGMLLVLVLLVGLSAIGVSAQGPTPTQTPGTGPVGGQTPAQAPAAPGLNNTFGNAATLGSAVGSLAAGAEQWYRFDYVTSNDVTPRPSLTVRLLHGVQNGLNFEVWSAERIGTDLADDHPVGRGTQEFLPNCMVTLPDDTTRHCSTNDLTWTGAFGAPGTYYIRIINNNAANANTNTAGNTTMTTNSGNTGGAVAPQLIVSGAGLGQCFTNPQSVTTFQGPTTTQSTTTTGNTTTTTTTTQVNTTQGFTFVTCENLGAGQLPSNFSSFLNGLGSGTSSQSNTTTTSGTNPPSGTNPSSGANQAATSTPAPTTAPTSAPTTAPSSTGATPAATSSSSSSSTLPPCTPTPTTVAGTPTAMPTVSGTATPSPTPNCAP